MLQLIVSPGPSALMLDDVLRQVLDLQDETPELSLRVIVGGAPGQPTATTWNVEGIMAAYQQADGVMAHGEQWPKSMAWCGGLLPYYLACCWWLFIHYKDSITDAKAPVEPVHNSFGTLLMLYFRGTALNWCLVVPGMRGNLTGAAEESWRCLAEQFVFVGIIILYSFQYFLQFPGANPMFFI